MFEVDPILLLSGIGMVSVGLLAIDWWLPRAGLRFFLYGGLLWAAAIAVKVLMDVTVTQSISQHLSATVGEALLTSVAVGLYVGVRTGLLECGLPYLVALKTRLRQVMWRDALAVGIGFGASEAILLGAQSLLNVVQLMLDPSILEMLPAEAREAVVRQLSYGVWIVPAPILERAFALVAHISATVLAVYAAKRAKPWLLAAAILYKTALDAPVPLLNHLAREGGLVGIYLSEAYVGAVALVGALGLIWFKTRRIEPTEAGYVAESPAGQSLPKP